MPCDQVRVTRVAFTEATDLEALALALEALGHERVQVQGSRLEADYGAVQFRDGRFTLRDTELDLPGLSRAYTKAVVLTQADQYGWQVETAQQGEAAVAGFSRKW